MVINESIITHIFCCWFLTFSEKNEEKMKKKKRKEKRKNLPKEIFFFFLPTAALGGPVLFLYFIFFPILPRIFSERMSILHGSYFICVGDWTLTTVFRYFNLCIWFCYPVSIFLYYNNHPPLWMCHDTRACDLPSMFVVCTVILVFCIASGVFFFFFFFHVHLAEVHIP